MSATITPKFNEYLDDLGRRLARLEQLVGDPKVTVGSGSSPQFNQVTVGAAGGPQVVLTSAVSPPTGLVLAAGSFFENIYVDASWAAPADGSAVDYEVVIARRTSPGVYELAQARRTISTAVRIEGLEPNTTYGVRVFAVGPTGVYSASLPTGGYQDITTGEDSTIPSPVTGLTLFSGATTITGSWNENPEPDVRDGQGMYEVQRDTVNTFDSVSLQARKVSATVTSWAGIAPDTTYFVRVRAVDSSGNEGPWSATVQAQANAITSSEIAAATITGDRIAGNTITGANILAGSVTGDRITANTLDANRLTTSSLTARTITLGAGGQIKVGTAGDTGGTGLLINDQGIRLYKSSSTPHTVLDATSGNATFSGSITASTLVGGSITGSNYYTGSANPRLTLGPSTQIDGVAALQWTNSQGVVAASIVGRIGQTLGIRIAGGDPGIIGNESYIGAEENRAYMSAANVELFGDLIVFWGPVNNTSSNVLRTKSGTTGKVVHFVEASVVTDANGFATVTHGFNTTPQIVVASPRAPISGGSIFGMCIVDSYTSSTFRIRAISTTGASLANASVTLTAAMIN